MKAEEFVKTFTKEEILDALFRKSGKKLMCGTV